MVRGILESFQANILAKMDSIHLVPNKESASDPKREVRDNGAVGLNFPPSQISLPTLRSRAREI
jgi:hypothetical protein